MTTTSAEESTARELAAWLRSQKYGDLRIRDVGVERREDFEGRDAWFFDVYLAAPAGGGGRGWDVDAVATMRRELRDKALDARLSYPWNVVLRAVDVAPRDEPE